MSTTSLQLNDILMSVAFVFNAECMNCFLSHLIENSDLLYSKLLIAKHIVRENLLSIKSVQMQFVKSSMLERRKIKMELEIEKMEENKMLNSPMRKRYIRFLRGCIYLLFYHYARPISSLFIIDEILVWPNLRFVSYCSSEISFLIFLGMCGLALRYVLRNIVSLLVLLSAV
jgi:hypothetical protein